MSVLDSSAISLTEYLPSRYPQVLGGSEVVEPGSLRWRV